MRKTTKSQNWKSIVIFVSWLFIGLSALLITNAYVITTNISNAVQYLIRTVITSDGWVWTATNTLFDVNYNTSWNVYIKNNLGIWTTGPIQKLHVNGSIYANGQISSEDSISSNGQIRGNDSLWTRGIIYSHSTNEIFPNIFSNEANNTWGIAIVGWWNLRYPSLYTETLNWYYYKMLWLHLKQWKSWEVYLLNSENYNMYLWTSGRNDITITKDWEFVLRDNTTNANCIATWAIKFSWSNFYACTWASIPWARVVLN